LPVALLPISLLMLLQAALAGGMWFLGRHQPTEMPVQENPSEMKSALGLLRSMPSSFLPSRLPNNISENEGFTLWRYSRV
jgi:hypothetical protein